MNMSLSPGHYLEVAQNEKQTNTMNDSCSQKLSKFLSTSLGHFFKHETLISEGWK